MSFLHRDSQRHVQGGVMRVNNRLAVVSRRVWDRYGRSSNVIDAPSLPRSATVAAGIDDRTSLSQNGRRDPLIDAHIGSD